MCRSENSWGYSLLVEHFPSMWKPKPQFFRVGRSGVQGHSLLIVNSRPTYTTWNLISNTKQSQKKSIYINIVFWFLYLFLVLSMKIWTCVFFKHNLMKMVIPSLLDELFSWAWCLQRIIKVICIISSYMLSIERFNLLWCWSSEPCVCMHDYVCDLKITTHVWKSAACTMLVIRVGINETVMLMGSCPLWEAKVLTRSWGAIRNV